MLRNINIDLLYQPTLQQPPINPEELQQRAASNDKPTMAHWKDIWVSQIKANKEKYGSFYDHSIGELVGKNLHKTAIVIGSGPSLKLTLNALRANQKMRNPLMTISCLHNLGFFVDEDIHADYYVTLDAGDIVIKDVFEGRQENADFYWGKTKDKTLLAYVATDPKLLALWQGKVLFFSTGMPDLALQKTLDDIEPFHHCVSSGGNALGACMYVAKAIMGSQTIVYVGADFCFDYDNIFHSYKTHYDDVGQFVVHSDVFGVPRKTWASYLNFKFWLDRIAMTVPGVWVNASFGTLGAYLGGNLACFVYMSLDDWLIQYEIGESVTKIEKVDGAPDKKSILWLGDYFTSRNETEKVLLF